MLNFLDILLVAFFHVSSLKTIVATLVQQLFIDHVELLFLELLGSSADPRGIELVVHNLKCVTNNVIRLGKGAEAGQNLVVNAFCQ